MTDPSAPAFAVTQGLVLALFVVLGWAALKSFGNVRDVGRAPARFA